MNELRYKELETKFKVCYPDIDNATYISPVNYSDDLSISKQRWYRYKEGFSVKLVEDLIKKYSSSKSGIILDPFLGSGTTIIGSNVCGFDGIGFEVNPFTNFLASAKIKNYPSNFSEQFIDKVNKILGSNLEMVEEYPLPNLSFAHKVFDGDIRKSFMKIRTLINKETGDIKNLLLLGWLSSLEELSNYRKGGNGLKFKKSIRHKSFDVVDTLKKKYLNIYEDLKTDTSYIQIFNNSIIKDSSLNLCNYVEKESIVGAIFSPPYANCFDYTEIYKLELWFGEFVQNREEVKSLRNFALRSNLNYKSINHVHSTKEIDIFIDDMDESLWDKRIPNMLRGYFDDMFTVIDNLKIVLKTGGFCCIVVGNSTYGGVVVPTDLLLADYAKNNGFIVDCVDVYRYIIPSSQQYEKTKCMRKYIRESVVCLIKK